MKLVFVYNADSGLGQSLLHLAHKWVSPETYPCTLCALTYEHAWQRPAWKDFVASLPLPVEFWHRDQWKKAQPASPVRLPAAFLVKDSAWQTLLSQQDFDACADLPALQEAVRSALDAARR